MTKNGHTAIPVLLCAALLLVPARAPAQQPAAANALAIVVIEGEGAVNIIQQKTAVRALVEVRDRNNLPVSGAAVTFKIGTQGGAALTGGSPTITVTTNAAGRAALSGGLTPTAPGTVQISVSAAYQGLTATAVIAQAVVATAAQAAAIGGAAAASAGAGGGGLGTGAIIGIVAGGVAVAGGAAVAGGLVAASGGEPHAANCILSVTPTVVTVPPAGGTFVITVVASPSDCDSGGKSGRWRATATNSFVTVTPSEGSGNGTVTVTIAPFMQLTANPPRTFVIAIEESIVNFSQSGGATSAQACIPELRQGASGEARRTELGSNTGTFLFSYASGQARMMVSYEGRALFDTGCAGAPTGTQSLSYAGRDTAVTVQVVPNCTGGSGTMWEYRLSCPR